MANKKKQATVSTPVAPVVRQLPTCKDILDSLLHFCDYKIGCGEMAKTEFLKYVQEKGIADAGAWRYLDAAQKEYSKGIAERVKNTVIRRMSEALVNEPNPVPTFRKEMENAIKHLHKHVIGNAMFVKQTSCTITNLNHQIEGAAYAEAYEEFSRWNEELANVAEVVPAPTASIEAPSPAPVG